MLYNQASSSKFATEFAGVIVGSMTTPKISFDHQISHGEVISSRFGDIMVDVERAVAFPSGLLGIPNGRSFVLANFPSEKMSQFRVLQSLDDTALAFITMPIALDGKIVATSDIEQAAGELGIDMADLVVLLVVSVHRSLSDTKISVNSRAPLFIDSRHKFGVQFVLSKDSYKVQHLL